LYETEHEVTKKSGYITNRMYTLGIRENTRFCQGVACLMFNLRKKNF